MTPAIDAYFKLLTAWNPRIRLTGSTDREALERHAAEAMSLLPHLDGVERLIDIGSGGGFPAVLLALVRPSMKITMVEPIAKKVAFLNTCRRELKLEQATVIRGRDDELPATELGYDAATSQATFAPTEWFRRAPRLVRVGGIIVGLLGDAATDLPPSVVLHDASTDDRTRRIAIQVVT